MSTKPDALAFPVFDNRGECNTDSVGLTKREYFAAMAMQGIMANADWAKTIDDEWGYFQDRVTDAAVDIADALIERLNKQ